MTSGKHESTRFSIALPGDLKDRVDAAAPGLGLRDANSVIGLLMTWALGELEAGRVTLGANGRLESARNDAE